MRRQGRHQLECLTCLERRVLSPRAVQRGVGIFSLADSVLRLVELLASGVALRDSAQGGTSSHQLPRINELCVFCFAVVGLLFAVTAVWGSADGRTDGDYEGPDVICWCGKPDVNVLQRDCQTFITVKRFRMDVKAKQ